MNRRTIRLCRNPICADVLERQHVLCPSCRFIGATGLAVGAVIAGILMKIFGLH